jgi:ABC-type amino acid transport substrate-binding protein
MTGRITRAFAAAIVGIAALTGADRAEARSLDAILESGELRIGVIPFDRDIVKDPTGDGYTGAFIDAAEFICERMDVTCAYQEVTWQSFVAALQAGRIDLSIASTYATISRATAVTFSDPIYFLGYKAVTSAEEGRFQSVAELDDPDVRVAVCQGCGQMEWVQRVAPEANLRVVPTEEGAMLEVVTGQADIAVGASAAANNALASQPSLRPALGGEVYSKNQVAWAMNRSDATLKDFVNIALGQLKASGRLAEFARDNGAPWQDAISP